MSWTSPLRQSADSGITCLLLACALGVAPQLEAQTITNPGFEGGSTGWSGCPLEINPASVYGGSGSNMVAEVDGDNDPVSLLDDKQLCQTISGFTIGSVYQLAFQAARRQGGPTPSTVSVNVNIDGALNATVTRTGTWNLSYEYLTFTATATTHTLRITPNFTVSYGMLFDSFGITLVSALPVELLSFEARSNADVVEVEWATASEQNSDRFVVERSNDNMDWTPLTEVPAAGESQSLLSYRAVDRTPLAGVAYYRLKQVDLDGSSTFSDTRAVEHRATHTELLIWPQPATDAVHVRVDEELLSVHVLDCSGRALYVPWERNGNVLVLQAGTLPDGLYHVHTEGRSVAVGRFLKL